jgi:hypothetical protein
MMEATAPVRRSGWVTLVGVLFIIGGFFNGVIGIVSLGVSLGGTDETVLGDLSGPIHNMEGLGIAVLIVGALQLIAGFGIINRRGGGQVLGLVLAGLAIVIHFAYYRVEDGWAFTLIAWNLIVIFILALRSEEFA